MTAILGYARVSTSGQDLDAQRQRLLAANSIRIFEDVISGRTFDRPGLSALLEFARPGDPKALVWVPVGLGELVIEYPHSNSLISAQIGCPENSHRRSDC